MNAKKILRLLTVAGILPFLSFSIIATNAMAQAEIRTVKPIKNKLNKQQSANNFPDLVVEKISLDKNQNIIIRIRNSGPGPIQKNQFKDCVVRVQFGRNQEDFYLGSSSKQGKPSVDPTGKLLKPGGSVSYNTMIRVHSTIQAGVFVDYRNTIVETDDANNKSDMVTLNPGNAKASPALTNPIKKTPSTPASRVGGALQRQPQIIPDTRSRIKASPSAIVAVPRVRRAFDLITSSVVLQGTNFGIEPDGRQIRLVRSNTAGNPVMTYFLSVRSWNSDEIIANMPDQLADPSNPDERHTNLSERSGRFTTGIYSRSQNRWVSNEVAVAAGTGNDTDLDRDGHVATRFAGDDCDDNNFDRYPGNPEVADFEGNDEDCNPVTIGVMDTDRDGYTDSRVWNDPAQFGLNTRDDSPRGNDCDDSRADVHPGQVEVCNGRDDNCDGSIDEGVMVTAYRDIDRDLYGDPSSPDPVCYSDLRSGLVTNNDDCDDADPTVNPREGNCP